ncbi:CHY zinc finger protein [Pseudogracilibacillus auburnensis]|uniref:Putative CHY-type Zn-finger protein n=1 Tax=Pseudogracilibacillus auburnensis TaxID=1494959 RepID=A0A2V3W7W4_9BACI|nr:CHY zinc finger protein [Pseudogracilibacillus auburnensis]MBO1001984.1 hypothetical protein [Pseudogracilibacillus auburnensis]PXW90212.1 putative CHY-type Zn-finger protein [Pseudogracilibacillus auburnensis]
MKINEHIIKGPVIDQETRCTHYHTELDRIAIKFYCCQTYFPCHLCHEEAGCGETQVWPQDKFDQKAILCGACGKELTINTYLKGTNKCPTCQAAFNPNCKLHEKLYFAI